MHATCVGTARRETETGARPRRPDSYLIVGGVFFLWACLLIWQNSWGPDIRVHYATLRALVRNLWIPEDPMVGAQAGSPYFSPYTVALALPVRLGLLSYADVFRVAALVNVVLFLWGFRRFCGHMSPKPRAAAAGLVLVTLLWGWQSVRWSGLLSAPSLAVELPYPSMFAVALMFLAWDALLRYRATKDTWRLIVLALVFAVVVLTHPFTGICAAVGLLAVLFGRPGAWRRADLLRLCVAATVAFALLVAWPYADVFALLDAPVGFAEIHRALLKVFVPGYGLAFLGLPALVLGRRHPLGRELSLLFVGGAAIIGYAAISGSYAFMRAVPILLIPLQLSLAAFLVEPSRRPGSRVWRGYAVVTMLACLISVQSDLSWVMRPFPSEMSYGPIHWNSRVLMEKRTEQKWRFITYSMHEGDVLMTRSTRLGTYAYRFGIYTVAPSWPDPFVRDAAERQAATAAFYATTTPAEERLRIADRYRVRCLFVRRAFTPQEFPTFHKVKTVGGFVFACRS